MTVVSLFYLSRVHRLSEGLGDISGLDTGFGNRAMLASGVDLQPGSMDVTSRVSNGEFP